MESTGQPVEAIANEVAYEVWRRPNTASASACYAALCGSTSKT